MFFRNFSKMDPEPGAGGGAPAPAPAPESGALTPAPAPAPAATWYDSVANAETKTWVAQKGWSSMDAALESGRHLEKLIGAPADEVVRLPKNPDEAAVRGVLSRLGLPETPDKYEIATVEGVPVDPEYAKWAQDIFHKVGLTASQAKALSTENATYVKQAMEKQEADYKANVAADTAALQSEWRNGYENQINKAKTAASQLGFTGEMVDAMESTVGYANTMKFFANLANKLGEDKFIGAEGPTGKNFETGMTPAEAKVEYERLVADPAFSTALLNKEHVNHKSAVAKKAQLHSIMHG